MTAFDEILADPFAPKAYLVTIRPCAFLAAEMVADAAENRLHAAPGTFLGLATGDWLRLGGFAESANRGWAMVIEVEPADPENPVAGPGGGWLALAGIDLADEAAGPRRLAGEVVRYFSSHGHVTRPEDVPPDTWYEPRIDNALTFTRALVDGDRIGGRSVPGFGDVVLRNEDGALDPLRVWGWAGRSIRVELGGPDFARAAFGVVFDGLTETVAFDDATLRIQVSDLQGLIEQPLWSARYLGSGGREGGADLKGRRKPLCWGRRRNIEPVPLGIVEGRLVYQFHDGPVAAYDADWHRVYDRGVALAYVAGAPGAAQWTLDAAGGCLILGGSPAGLVTADVLGGEDGLGFVEATADIIRRLVTTRLQLQSELSVSSLEIGTGPRVIEVPDTLPVAIGSRLLIAKEDEVDSVWMHGTVTARDGEEATVAVDRCAGLGTHESWLVSLIGLGEEAVDGDSLDALADAVPGAVGLWLGDPEAASATEVLDLLVAGIGGFYGFTRAGRFHVGRLDAPDGEPVLAIDGTDALELRRLGARPAVWRLAAAYRQNNRVLRGNDLAGAIRDNVVTLGSFESDAGWTLGAGWSVSAGHAAASAGSSSDLSRTVSLVPGQTYVLTAAVTRSSGTVQAMLDGAPLGAAVATSGTLEREVVAPSAAPTLAFAKDAGFAGQIDDVTLTAKAKSFFETEWRMTDAATDGEVRAVQGPSAVDERIVTLFDDEADAAAERDRQFALFSTVRDVFEVTLKTQPFRLDVGDLVEITDRRFGLRARRLRVLAVEEDAGRDRAVVKVWG
jgi:hypothetical protein